MQLNKKPGPAIFCDQFNLEFSRDIEMMKGGYGDNYYMQMAANIRRFKGMAKPEPISAPKSIDIAGSCSQWDEVLPAYRDHVNETLPRDFKGCGAHHYKVDTGRNDFTLLKVARDEDTVYFYARTREAISAHTGPGWMWLFIDVKGSGRPDWEGFNYLVNRNVTGSGTTSLEVCTGGWDWKPVGTVEYRVEGKQMQIAIPKTMLGLKGESVSIEFKWMDNSQEHGDILDGYVNGDAAPGGRFGYRYETK